jgi:hypothetical protein
MSLLGVRGLEPVERGWRVIGVCWAAVWGPSWGCQRVACQTLRVGAAIGLRGLRGGQGWAQRVCSAGYDASEILGGEHLLEVRLT